MDFNYTNVTSRICGQENEFFYTKFYLYSTVSIFILITIFTFVGNLLVVVAIATTKSLNTVTNSFIMSLAVADMLVAIFVLPLSIYVISNDHKWTLSSIMCDIWAAFDVMLCTASILNLCCISVDRYFAITRPLKYSRARSPNLARNMIAVVWITSVLISCPPIFGWKDPHRYLNPQSCSLNLLLSYRIYSSIGSFYLPALVIIFVYARIFIVIHKREKLLALNSKESTKIRATRGASKALVTNKKTYNCQCNNSNVAQIDKLMEKRKNLIKLAQIKSSLEQIHLKHLTDNRISNGKRYLGLPIDRSFPINYTKSRRRETMPAVSYDDILNDTHLRVINERKCSTIYQSNTLPCTCPCAKRLNTTKTSILFKNDSDAILFVNDNFHKLNRNVVRKTNCCSWLCPRKRIELNLNNEVFSRNNASIQSNSNGSSSRHHERIHLNRESKASKVLAIVVAGFICCWLPFFIMYVLESICTTCCFSIFLIDWITWLGYINSVINPFIYAFYSKPFRSAFYRITLARFKNNSQRKSLIV